MILYSKLIRNQSKLSCLRVFKNMRGVIFQNVFHSKIH